MRALVFAAHPDDEVIAVGGTIRKLANAGAEIRLVHFSDGAEGYTTLEEKHTIVDLRRQETGQVCAILGIGSYTNLHLQDWNLQVGNSTYHAVIREIRTFKPDIVFTHTRADYHDHMTVHDVVTDGWFHAPLPCAMDLGPVWKYVPLYEFEVRQPISAPSLIVDVSDTFDAKVKAMQCYGSQLEHVGSIFQMMEGRAKERGYLGGGLYGEALLRTTFHPIPVHNVNDLMKA